MEIIIDFPGGAKVDAHFNGFTLKTDQPAQGGGENSAPSPFDHFLASIGTCAGIYVLGFCRQRGLPTEGIQIVERINRGAGGRLAIDLEIQVPPTFPERYKEALINTANLCAVKKALDNPPTFNTYTKVVEMQK